jgi:hypothetical protein
MEVIVWVTLEREEHQKRARHASVVGQLICLKR